MLPAVKRSICKSMCDYHIAAGRLAEGPLHPRSSGLVETGGVLLFVCIAHTFAPCDIIPVSRLLRSRMALLRGGGE